MKRPVGFSKSISDSVYAETPRTRWGTELKDDPFLIAPLSFRWSAGQQQQRTCEKTKNTPSDKGRKRHDPKSCVYKEELPSLVKEKKKVRPVNCQVEATDHKSLWAWGSLGRAKTISAFWSYKTASEKQLSRSVLANQVLVGRPIKCHWVLKNRKMPSHRLPVRSSNSSNSQH